jgi:NhaP-type Na+/H+ and K+/H+ antiporter
MTFSGGTSWSEALFHAPILALSAQTTAGFSNVEVASLEPASKLALILAMLVGGVDEESDAVEDLDLSESARVICFYRGGEFHLADGRTKLAKEDEMVILTHSKNLAALRERWRPKQAGVE